MVHLPFTRQCSSHITFKLFLSAIVIVVLTGCGRGGSAKSSSEKIPDAYRASSTSNYSAAVEGSGDTDAANTGVIKLSWSAPATKTASMRRWSSSVM